MSTNTWRVTGCLVGVLFAGLPAGTLADDTIIAPPGSDETLILLYRKNAFGHGYKHWIAVNDQTVARIKEKHYAEIRANAGLITLNLATQGGVLDVIQLDDRPGETVYLHWKLGDSLREISAEEGAKLVRKAKRMKPIEAPLPNNEQVATLINVHRLGFDVMQAADAEPAPGEGEAVIVFFRRGEKTLYDLSVWSEHGLVGSLGRHQRMAIAVPPGEHYFLAGAVGTSLLKAQVEAGKRYHAWLDIGKMIGRVRLTPVEQSKADKLHKWLGEAEMVSLDENALTPRLLERGEIVADFVRDAATRARAGTADTHDLGSPHAF